MHNIDRSVESVLKALKFDNWVHPSVSIQSSTLIMINGLASHSHGDHNPTKSPPIPQTIIVPERFERNFRQITQGMAIAPSIIATIDPRSADKSELDRSTQSIAIQGKKMAHVLEIGPNFTYVLTGRRIYHASWFRIKYEKKLILFVGELDVSEVDVLDCVVERITANVNLDCIMIPSYGGMDSHGSTYPTELSNKIGQLVSRHRNKIGFVVGLPHTVDASWADLNFVRQPLQL